MVPNLHFSVYRTGALSLSLTLALGCASEPARQPSEEPPRASDIVIQAPSGIRRPPFKFNPDDARLLDEIEHAAFAYFWKAAAPETGMIPDRTSKSTVSIAGVGFELSALPIGVERGWVSRDEARQRAELILRSLSANPDNRKAGMFYHFLDPRTAGQPKEAYERAVSTIDSALFFAGAITASSYFGGEVARLADRLVSEADWSFFVARANDSRVRGGPPALYEVGFISLSWRPDDPAKPSGEGKLSPYYWLDSGDEHRLVTFLAVCAPDPAHRVPPRTYYGLRREVGSYADTGPFVWFPYSGALFTYFFAHCWIDYSALGPDDPASQGVANRARVDWWENSRRAARMHRLKAIENPAGVPTLGPDAWGLTASDVPNGYGVPGLYPTHMSLKDERPDFDFGVFDVKDDFGGGTVAPYGAGCAIMFDPEHALSALHHYRDLKRPDGSGLVWHDPSNGGYGFQDAYNEGTGWVSSDCVAIDQGPLILAIENARTGLVWRLFHAHPSVREGLRRLGLVRERK